jgi:MFS family permease
MNPAGTRTLQRDRALLYSGTFLRAVAIGQIGVLMGVYLAENGFDAARIGMIVAAGLAGGAVAALLVTLGGDRFGRKRSLLTVSALTCAGGAWFAITSSPWAAAIAAFLGMVNGMGRDRGATLILDQAILPGTVADEGRTRVFAIYNVLQDVGGALGGLLAGLPVVLRRFVGPAVDAPAEGADLSLRLTIGVYVGLAAVAGALYCGLSRAVELPAGAAGTRPPRLSPGTRRVLWGVGSLFALDSLAGGFMSTAILAFFFHQRFGVSEGAIGALFFAARVANAASHLAAARLARRFGLVNTMVFTHIPSSLLLITVAWAPGFAVAAALFILREGLVEMDVPTRQSWVMAVVRPEERMVAAGVTNLVRVGAWSVAPSFAGWFMTGWSLTVPLVIGSLMKIAYDILLYFACRRTLPPEEARRTA